MLCPECRSRIREGEPCPFCNAVDPALVTTFCTGCGNDYYGDACPDCAAADESADRRGSDRESDWEHYRKRDRRVLCPECGNEIQPGLGCDVCAIGAAKEADQDVVRFCTGCGNEIYGNGDCAICSAGLAPTKKAELVLCPGCGNDVEDIHQCPVCLDGRAIAPSKEKEDRGPVCPQCDEVLEAQEWDGVEVLMCSSCQGCLFGPGGLEATLDKLRHTAESSDLSSLAEDFKERLHARPLRKKVRYKPCPVCHMSMTRRNYKRVSGIIVDVCGRHGTWVDQSQFGQLSDWVTRGGDAWAARKRL